MSLALAVAERNIRNVVGLKMKDNIIKFNAKKIEFNDQSEYDDFEDWESDAEFFYKQDWDGLEKYRYSKVLKNPNDVYNQWMLGDAYVLAKKYDEAINILAKLHKQDPEDPNIQISLLDALFASGKDESDMDWVIKPSVLRLNSYTLDCCYDFMKGKRKLKTVYELHLNLYSI